MEINIDVAVLKQIREKEHKNIVSILQNDLSGIIIKNGLIPFNNSEWSNSIVLKIIESQETEEKTVKVLDEIL